MRISKKYFSRNPWLFALIFIGASWYSISCVSTEEARMGQKESALVQDDSVEPALSARGMAEKRISSESATSISDVSKFQDAGTFSDASIPKDAGASSQKLFSEQEIHFAQGSAEANYLLKYVENDSITRIRPVEINLDVLRNSSTIFNLFNGKSYLVERGDFIEHGPGILGWAGKIDPKEGEIILAVYNGKVLGSFRNTTEYYEIRPLGDKYHVLVDYDISILPQVPEDSKDWSDKEEIEKGTNESAKRLIKDGIEPNQVVSENIGEMKGTKSDPTVYRVLLAYTTAAADYVSSYSSSMALESYYFMVYLHNSYYLSAIDDEIDITLVGALELTYSECAAGNAIYNKNVDKLRFAYYQEYVCCGMICFGAMDIIHSYREQYAADICMLIRAPNEGGQAMVIGADTSSEGFLVASNANAQSALFSRALTLNHEMGHLSGCCHQIEKDSCQPNYAHGYCHCSGATQFRTLVSTSAEDAGICQCERKNYYSDPDLTENGVARGVDSESECSFRITETASTIDGLVSTQEDVTLDHDIKEGEYGFGIATDDIITSIQVENSGTLYMQANTITLESGFHAKQGSILWAGKDLTP